MIGMMCMCLLAIYMGNNGTAINIPKLCSQLYTYIGMLFIVFSSGYSNIQYNADRLFANG